MPVLSLGDLENLTCENPREIRIQIHTAAVIKKTKRQLSSDLHM